MLLESELFLDRVRGYLQEDEYRLVEKALGYAISIHRPYKRLSGEPYAHHVIAVADILAEWHAPADVLAAALLHDSGKERYAIPPDPDELKGVIGEKAAYFVEQVARLGRFGPRYHARERSARQLSPADRFRTLPWAKVVLQQAPEAVVIKIADRIDNFRTLKVLPRNRRRAFAHGVRNIFIPFAQSLGMQKARRTLEDEAFRILEANQYQIINKYLSHEYCKSVITEAVAQLKNVLAEQGVTATVQCAEISRFQIYRQRSRGAREEEVILPPLQVIVKDAETCYRTLGIIHALWEPYPAGIRDHIATPKDNGFQALQTRVRIPDAGVIQIAIQDPLMHLVSEYGFTAQWMDKRAKASLPIQRLPELPPGKIAVFTPEEEIKILPKGATPVDFAYAIHPELGHQCSGAVVNGQTVSLMEPLNTGDFVRILTSATRVGPDLAWLEHVKTPKARREIRKWYKRRSPGEARRQGYRILDERFRAHGLTLSSKDLLTSLKTIASNMNYKSLDDLFVDVGVGRRSAESIIGQHFFLRKMGNRAFIPSASILSLDNADLPHRLAKCCNPRPPDPIVGYKTRDGVVTIHRADCRIAKKHRPLFSAEWTTSLEPDITQIVIEAVDRPGLIRDVSTVVANRGLAMSSFHADRIKDGSAVLQIVFDISLADFPGLKNDLMKLSDVRKVHAMTPSLPSLLARDAVVTQLFHNPYTLSPATGRNFVGRKRELQQLVNHLRGISPGQAVLLWGPRRIGKTSLLLHFQHSLLNRDDYVVAYLNLHNLSGQSTTQFLYEILRAIAKEVSTGDFSLLRYQKMRRDPLGYFNSFIRDGLPLSSRHIVLLFDEFQFITKLREEKVTLQDINLFFRDFIQQRVAFTVIFSGGGVLSDLRRHADAVSLLEVTHFQKITRLKETDARELITEPVRGLHYTEPVIEQLVQLTASHPYFLQLLCSQIFDYAQENQITEITQPHLNNCLEQSWRQQAEHYFSHLWGDGVLTDRSQLKSYRLVLFLIALSAEPGSSTDFESILQTGVTRFMPEEKLWQTMKGLMALDSITRHNQDEFQVSIPFAQQWIHRNYTIPHIFREWTAT